MEEAARMADDPTLFTKGAASVAALFGAAKNRRRPVQPQGKVYVEDTFKRVVGARNARKKRTQRVRAPASA
eukprot:5304648-Alexandrium_andersonii.AAC.1